MTQRIGRGSKKQKKQKQKKVYIYIMDIFWECEEEKITSNRSMSIEVHIY